MKQIVCLLILASLVASCSTVNVPSPKQYASCIDYGYLSQKGVYVSESNSVNFEYEPLGSLYVECTGGWVKNNQRSAQSSMEDIYYSKGQKVVYQPATVEDAFSQALGELKKLRGNGIINFKINTISEYLPAYQVSVNKIIITGMCIRR